MYICRCQNFLTWRGDRCRRISAQRIKVYSCRSYLLMVENSGKCHSLFFPAGQNVFPVGGRVPSAFFPLYQMRQMDSGQTRFQVLFGYSFGLHVRQGIGINDLLLQTANCHVWSAKEHFLYSIWFRTVMRLNYRLPENLLSYTKVYKHL